MDYRHTVFVGVDPHKFQHTAVVINCWNEVLGTVSTKNHPTAFPAFLKKIGICVPTGFKPVFGLEDCYGFGRHLTHYLVQAGYVVKAVQAVQAERERRHRARPEKSDPVDARSVAQVLVKEWHSLPDAALDPLHLAIAHAYRHRNSVVESVTRAKNRLHALLTLQYPSHNEWFSNPFGPTALDFWQRCPSAPYLRRMKCAGLTTFLGRRNSGRLGRAKAEQILASLLLESPDGEAESMRATLIQYNVSELRQLIRITERLEAHLTKLLARTDLHLTSIPGVGVVTAAGLVAEIGPIERFASADKLAAFAGIAPVERSSGTRRRHRKSRSGRRSLHRVLYHIALCQISGAVTGRAANPAAKSYFLRKVSEGKTRRAAMTCVMRRLIAVVYAMMRDRTVYQAPANRSAVAD